MSEEAIIKLIVLVTFLSMDYAVAVMDRGWKGGNRYFCGLIRFLMLCVMVWTSIEELVIPWLQS